MTDKEIDERFKRLENDWSFGSIVVVFVFVFLLATIFTEDQSIKSFWKDIRDMRDEWVQMKGQP